MTNDTEIQPALTAEEWKRFAVKRAGLDIEKFRDLFEGRPTRNQAVRIKGDHVQLVEPDEAHALAALALYGQPFGFTHEDVEFLNMVTTATAPLYGNFLRDLAARIAALLPPR